MHLSRHSIGVALFLGCAALAAQQRPQPPSTPALYTAEQAVAGEKIYFAQCASCHGDDLAGREKATALAGAQFFEAWNGKDLRRLLDRIETMPPTAPKSLPADQYLSVLAFLLRHADMPDGSTALPIGRAQLARIAFGRPPASNVPGAPAASAAGVAPGVAAAPARTAAIKRGSDTAWTTYGGNLASQRYSPADQITKENFNQLEIAWRLKTDFLGPRPDTLYSATPLLVDRTLYTTAGTRRAAIALNAVTGEMLWMHASAA
jgi:mono/diheme cytochrome c family protein